LAGNILGATELKAATKYKYSDLKVATKNFSEKNKLGEGGFGAVYKVKLSCSSTHFNHDSKSIVFNIKLSTKICP